jgi:hypothetical protein
MPQLIAPLDLVAHMVLIDAAANVSHGVEACQHHDWDAHVLFMALTRQDWHH